VTSRYATSMVFLYKWLIDRCIHRVCYSSDLEVGYKPPSPAGVFTVELTALLVILQVEEVFQLAER
jgi:hypothetical protein